MEPFRWHRTNQHELGFCASGSLFANLTSIKKQVGILRIEKSSACPGSAPISMKICDNTLPTFLTDILDGCLEKNKKNFLKLEKQTPPR